MRIPVQLINYPLVSYRIIPDQKINNADLPGFIKLLHELYKNLFKRVVFAEKNIEYETSKKIVWEVHISKDDSAFYILVPETSEKSIINRLESVYPNSLIQKEDLHGIDLMNESNTLVSTVKYEKHPINSINTDIKNNAHLRHLLSISKSLNEGEQLIIQTIIKPTSQDWRQTFKEVRPNKPRIIDNVVDEFSGMVEETISQIIEGKSSLDKIKTDKEAKKPAPRIVEKMMSVGFNTQIRIAVTAKTLFRREDLMLSAATAFRACDYENNLIKAKKEVPVSKFINRDYSGIRLTHDLMSAEEIAKLIQLPTADIFELGLNMKSIKIKGAGIPECARIPGIPIGTADLRGEPVNIHFPTDSVDSLCLPRAVIGEMGSGKSSLASNFAIEAFNKNYNVVALDVADGRMVRQIRDAVPPEMKHRVKHLDFGNLEYPIPLTWNESTLTPNRMASEFIKFIEIVTGELGVRTRRWMKKAFLAAFEDKSATVMDVLNILLDDKYRAKRIPKIQDKAVREAWIEFGGFSEKDKNDILNPVMNRLDYITDDDNLMALFGKEPKKINGECIVDFRKWLNQDFTKEYESNLILITVPKIKYGSYATDIVVAFLINKIWLTLQARNPNTVLHTGVPTFVLMDEPHQFMRSAELWREMVVETRKWRGAMVWFFHTWEQIKSRNPSLAKEMKSAGIHYVLYRSSKDTWRDLSEEITPFTVEEALEIPKYHAIVKVAGENPMLCKMVEPIDMRLPVYSNTDISYFNSRSYGINKDQIRIEEEVENNEPNEAEMIILPEEIIFEPEIKMQTQNREPRKKTKKQTKVEAEPPTDTGPPDPGVGKLLAPPVIGVQPKPQTYKITL